MVVVILVAVAAAFSPHVGESGFRKLGNFFLWNRESQVLESGVQLKQSRIPLTVRIQAASSADKESVIWYLESGIHGVEIVLDSFTWSKLFSKAKPKRRISYIGGI